VVLCHLFSNGFQATFIIQFMDYKPRSALRAARRRLSHLNRCPRAQPVSECDRPEERGAGAFATWGPGDHPLAGGNALRILPCHSVLFQPINQDMPGNAEKACGLGPIATGAGKGLTDEVLFQVGKAEALFGQPESPRG